MGITQPFPIQRMTLQIAMGGHDLIGQARTGTGKTLGFGVPLLERVQNAAEGGEAVRGKGSLVLYVWRGQGDAFRESRRPRQERAR